MPVDAVMEVPPVRVREPQAPTLRNPLDAGRPIRAVLFDLDGTLYHQPRMRLLMAVQLAAYLARHPVAGRRVARILSAFRRAQESLRGNAGTRPAAVLQMERAAERAGVGVAEVEAAVAEWMFERPLRHLAGCRAVGMVRLLAFLQSRKIPLGVLSDYPADGKLRALGIGDNFSLVLSASDPEVGVFKPHPRGFLAACRRWQLDPADVLFVGDRADADAAGAAAAGMPCVIVGKTQAQTAATGRFLLLPTLERLRCVLDDDN